MKKNIFEGSGVALVTPFDEKGKVNYFELKRLIEFQIASNTNAIVILGTTGESATISQDERISIIKFCVSLVSKQIPVIVGTGSNNTETAIKLSKQAEELGADACLVVSPYYNKCNQNGVVKHYKQIANSTKLPIIIYNVPSRTGVNILPETVKKLSKIKNIVAIKEASGNFAQITKLLNIVPKNFAVYSGDDLLSFSMMCLGAKGVISVTANCYPTIVSNMCTYALKNDFFNAKRLHDYLLTINESLFLDVNPICVKTYMNIIGFNVGKTRLPLCETSSKILSKLKKVSEQYEN